jgi:hypothetical protein
MSEATSPPREWRLYVEDIDDDTLWSIVSDDLVPLRAPLTRLLAGQP